MKQQIGIDLGTTNCCVALAEGDTARVLQFDGRTTMPSIVAQKTDGTILVGTRAKTCTNPLFRHVQGNLQQIVLILAILIYKMSNTLGDTLTALLAYLLARDNRVSVVDADPSLNLALALGIPASQAAKLIPLAEMRELIEKRVGSRDGGFFKLNPRVDDLADRISFTHNGIRLLVMGTITQGGAGCACKENVLLRSFLSHLLLEEGEVVLVDMEAGLEHLGRRTIQAVDALLVVVEPGQRSISVAQRIKQLSANIGLKRVLIVGNKLKLPDDTQIIRDNFSPDEILGLIPYSQEILAADRKGTSPYSSLTPAIEQELLQIKTKLIKLLA